jgi:hypothetical protein
MSDPTYTSVKIRQASAGVVADLLTLDAVDASTGTGAALSFLNNSAVDPLHFALGRISARRVDANSVQLDLAIASDPTASSSDDTPPALSLLRDISGVSVITPAGTALSVGGALAVTSATTLSGTLSVTGATTLGALVVNGTTGLNSDLQVNGNITVNGTVDGRDLSADGTRLDQHLARTNNPHATTAAQVGALALTGGAISGTLSVTGATTVGGTLGVTGATTVGGTLGVTGATTVGGTLGVTGATTLGSSATITGILNVHGDIRASSSAIYFTETAHAHTGFGNTAGYAAIENAANYNGLMILGRAGTPNGRAVRLWDYLQVNGNLDVTSALSFGAQTRQMINLWSTGYGIGVQGGTQYYRTDGNFAWYRGGAHSDNALDPGGGTLQMSIQNDNVSVSKALHVGGTLSTGIYNQNSLPSWSGGGIITWDLFYGGGTYKASTIRIKENVQPLIGVLDRIEQLNPVRFDHRDNDRSQHDNIGFIAEEVREVAPECIGADGDFFAWGVNESAFHALAIAGIQELARKVKRLERHPRQRRRRVYSQRPRQLAPPTIEIIRESAQTGAAGELYITVKFSAHPPALGSIETVRTFRLPVDLPREQFLVEELERWMSMLESPSEGR